MDWRGEVEGWCMRGWAPAVSAWLVVRDEAREVAGEGLALGGVEAGETPEAALRRELLDELGLEGGQYVFSGIHVRRVLWLGHTVVLYRVTGMTGRLQPNCEIKEVIWADLASLPQGLTPATARRLAELAGAPVTERW